MPTWTNINTKTFEDFQIAFNRYMEYFVSHLNSKNVKRLDTNETVVKSADGTTYINGPVLEMSDGNGTLRLKQGYDSSTGNFVYQLADESGSITMEINSEGEAVFRGNIETKKNATIGQILKLQAATGTDIESGIKWMDNDGVTELAEAFMFKSDTLNLFSVKSNNSELDLVADGGDLYLTSLTGSVILNAPGVGIVCIGSAIANNKVLTSYEIDTRISAAVDAAVSGLASQTYVDNAIKDHEDDDTIYNSHVEPAP